MSKEVTSTIYGAVPWSDNLLNVSGDIRRNREIDESKFTDQLASDRQYNWHVIEESGITYFSDMWEGGKLDYFRDTVKASDGFADDIDSATNARWLNTNTFFRQPDIAGRLSNTKNHRYEKEFDWLDQQESEVMFQPTLVSPYTFSKLSARTEGIGEAKALSYVTGLYDQILASAASRGVRHILLHEPYAAYEQVPSTERKKIIRNLGKLAANHSEIDIGVYFSFGDASKILRDVIDSEVEVSVGCDLQLTPYESLPELSDRRFFAGLVTGDNTLMQSDESIVDELEKFNSNFGPWETSLTHTIDLEYLPQKYALEKIKQIGRVARLVNGAAK